MISRLALDDVRRALPRAVLALSAAAIGIAGVAVARPARALDVNSPDCTVPKEFKPLSSCRSGAGKDVLIGGTGACKNVYVDRSFLSSANDSLGKVTIAADGILMVAEQTLDMMSTLQIDTTGIVVAGVFEVGSDQCPIGSNNEGAKVILNFLGSRPPCNDLDNCDAPRKGIDVQQGGTLRLLGRRGVPSNGGVSWTYLSEAAGPDRYARKTNGGKETKVGSPVPPGGEKTLQLAADVSRDWHEGDWIAVGTTSFSPYETEFVQIGKPMKNGGGSVVPLKQSLKYYHFGGPDPGAPGKSSYLAPRDKNYGVDERALVALMSRNIKLTATIPSTAGSEHWGGELRFLKGFAEVSIQGVEIEKFGKDMLGSYPVHFHMDGDVRNKPIVDANAVHHSYNKCITVHSTQNITVSNNACARIVGHIFYQEIGDEFGTKFDSNIGLGAMSNSFDVNAPDEAQRQELIKKFWWAGDNLTNDPMSASYIGYDGFRVPNTDNQTNPTHGTCYRTNAQGGIVAGDPVAPPCKGNDLYTEPASGFWIINPGTTMVGNAINGCQGVGRAIWYVPPPGSSLTHLPLGEFRNNRGSSCYSGLYAENEYSVISGQLLPRVGGKNDGQPLITQFNGMIAARNRFRGIWLRPTWFVVKDARLATNRESASLVTAGGADGLAPGVWSLFQDSVVVGVSKNNVDRFGPCPYQKLDANQKEGPGQLVGTGGEFGCIDQTPRTAGGTVRGGDEIGLGYADPHWNLQGYMIYDGPTRIFNDRFVNFNVDLAKNLTTEDLEYFAWYSDKFKLPKTSPPQNFIYEGDATFGWFQSNFSSYPTSTATKGLLFENVDLRHQIYTEEVNLGPFHDGDKNTAVLDLDGTLTGFKVVDSNGADVHDAHPISLNNLEFNLSSNGADECLAEGAQDTFFEGRPTSLISPGAMATLEFTALFPNPGADINKRHDQLVTFTKDSKEFVGTPYEEQPTMTLEGRNGNGLWEPKVTHGYGYTVSASAGIPSTITVGLVDAVKPDEIDPISKLPVMNYAVRMGVCYADAAGNHPDDSAFTVSRGYKSYGGANVEPRDTELQQYWNLLFDRWQGQRCKDKDNDNPDNVKATKGCPADGVTAVPKSGTCPAGSEKVPSDGYGQPACIYAKTTMTRVMDIKELSNAQGKPELDKYFYDKATGMLYFNVAQGPRNAVGPSPLGNCGEGKSNPSCPDVAHGEAYYPCPAEGCWIYRVDVAGSYAPGPSNCKPYPKYAQDPPKDQPQLAYNASDGAVVKRTAKGGKDNKFPHFETNPKQVCKVTSSGLGGNDDLGSVLP